MKTRSCVARSHTLSHTRTHCTHTQHTNILQKPRTQIYMVLWYTDPPNKGTKLLLQVIKAIITYTRSIVNNNNQTVFYRISSLLSLLSRCGGHPLLLFCRRHRLLFLAQSGCCCTRQGKGAVWGRGVLLRLGIGLLLVKYAFSFVSTLSKCKPKLTQVGCSGYTLATKVGGHLHTHWQQSVYTLATTFCQHSVKM